MFENYLSVFSVFCHKHKIVLITLVSEIIDLYSKIMFLTHWTWLRTFETAPWYKTKHDFTCNTE